MLIAYNTRSPLLDLPYFRMPALIKPPVSLALVRANRPYVLPPKATIPLREQKSNRGKVTTSGYKSV
jgi:hypothetical protein